MSRDTSLDIAKGIGIIAVVIGHCLGPCAIKTYISTFHMPLFFIIAGMCINVSKYDIVTYISKRAKSLLLPFLFYTVLNYIVQIACLGTERTSFYELPIAMWFLLILWLSQVVYFTLYKLIVKYKLHNVWGGGILLFNIIIALCFYHYSVKLPYHLHAAPISIFFLGLGHLLRNKILTFKNWLSEKTIRFPWILLMLLVPVYSIVTDRNLNVSQNEFGFPDYIVACIMVMGVIALSNLKFVKFFWFLQWLGQNTLVILGLHMVFVYLSIYFIHPHIDTKIVYKAIEQLFTWSMSLLCIVIVNKYAKWLAGK